MGIALDEKVIKVIIWVLYFVGLYFSLFWLSVFFIEPNRGFKRRIITWPEVSIIIPLYNEQDSVEETIRSVYNLDYPRELIKVIAVNDGSTDNSLKILNRLQKELGFTAISQKNRGKYAAMNAGLKIVDTPFFACFDADSIVEKSALKKLISEFDRRNTAAVMPIMKVYKPKALIEYVQWLEYQLNIFYKSIMGKLDCIHVVPGPFSVYRTEIVKKIGGFKKGHLTEDLELALRLQDNNFTLKQSLEAVVYTKSPSNTKSFISQRVRWYQGTMLNIKDYRHFIFNKKYGDFGIYHIPMVTLTGFLAILGFFLVVYLFIKGAYHTLKNWYLTHFDFWTYISNWRWNQTALDFNWQMLFFTVIVYATLLFSIYLAAFGTRERINIFRNIKHFFMFLYFFIIYQIVMGYIWIKVVIRLMLGKTNKWVKVS